VDIFARAQSPGDYSIIGEVKSRRSKFYVSHTGPVFRAKGKIRRED
jgi:hypothetical protein